MEGTTFGYYSDGKRRWKSTHATTKPEALKVLTEFRELIKERVRHVSLNQFISALLAYAQSTYSPKSVVMFRAVLGQLVRLCRDFSLREISAEHIDKFKARRLSQISPVSVNVELRTLRSAFSTARRWKLIESNPFDGVSLAQVQDQSPLALTQADFERLLLCIKELVVFAVLTGMRRGELLNPHWSDVDLTRRVIRIQSSSTFRTKQGRRRTIPLSDPAFYLVNRKQGQSLSEYVFSVNDKPINGGWTTHLFKRYLRSAGLSNPRFRFHSLRHTFASWLVQSGVPIFEVQKLLGHSSVKVTEVYSHIPTDELFQVVNKIQFRS